MGCLRLPYPAKSPEPWLGAFPPSIMGNSPTKLSQRLERAEKTGVLALRDCGLEKVPDRVVSVAGLRVLDMSHNKLTSLPSSLSRLEGLKDLSLDANKLASLPAQICMLPRLETLSAPSNDLTSLPGAIGSLVKLRKLVLTGNRLTALPDSLCACSSLQLLDASRNRLAPLDAGASCPQARCTRPSRCVHDVGSLPCRRRSASSGRWWS